MHNRHSIRLKGYDYSQSGLYFITICVNERWNHRFGEVHNGEMVLTEAGQIAAEEWAKTTEIRDNVSLDSWVIMPNHIHGIIQIHPTDNVGAHCMRPINGERPDNINEQCPDNINEQPGRVRRVPTIGDIVRGYKSAVTKRVRQLPGMHDIKLWQRNYWEHIIRDERAHFLIREYIQNNPTRWEADCFNRKGTVRRAPTELRETRAEYKTNNSNNQDSFTVNEIGDWIEIE